MNRRDVPDFGGRDSGLSDFLRDVIDSGYGPPSGPASPAPGPPAGRGARSWQVVAVVVLLLAGVLLAVSYRHVLAEQPSRAQVRADLEGQIHQRQQETGQLRQQAQRLRDEVTELRDRQLSDPAAVRQLRDLEAVTGLRRVHGDGVVVTVADGPAQVDPVTGDPVADPQSRILYRDLQQLTNALWAAGAEAVAVNGQRLTVTSTIRSASGAILVDRQPVAGPYELVAVGPPELATRFAGSEVAGLMKLLGEEYGIGYELRQERELTLPAAAEPSLRYSTPAPVAGSGEEG